MLKFNLNFIFSSNKKNKNNKDKCSFDDSKISITNNPTLNRSDLSLIELKMLESHHKENKNQINQQNILRLEMDQKINQMKLENKIFSIEQKNYLEKHKLEQQIIFLEKEIEKIKNKNKSNQKTESFSEKQEDKNINEEKINLDYIDKVIKKQMPKSLKKIFEKISDLENVQLHILNKLMYKNKNSYYDHSKNILYVKEKDLVFIKTLLFQKKEENKRLN
ncbi:MAG: hypothetical protein Q8781_00630 [Candidatus Phytoplasma stylosanthis]|uniref:hypothetical protein n=1 Tax=Candidatus Phytoplasma stylosanthis TaxID=2798314 RepID=UPI00293B40A7|nr:hypothetical protein [Candidatus Phytoplasma stylosanthis]MDV3168030.1 hypothetical protein [Candidatus Phytoplasma stylosanthis]MDV3170794.1 hypothetical protein [Candidatus Phytoplasma stylosanthis]MDV3173643.1 hypothetical protein [Candidatus Phytoplasma stylosanthis]MDV3174192.1 hypothetical protein [Candidatus Phytoplasma stylosanthis]MDV3202517.1 hypothetical protein [Candidatus Phytoplasma stylosanthis]